MLTILSRSSGGVCMQRKCVMQLKYHAVLSRVQRYVRTRRSLAFLLRLVGA